jgi:hypothetical protein
MKHRMGELASKSLHFQMYGPITAAMFQSISAAMLESETVDTNFDLLYCVQDR